MIQLRRELYQWHQTIDRDLPWKEDENPYKIWLSEVILQQTRVEQGKPYYYKFMDRWPTIEDLARANEDEVLSLWQGLGYYSRGRNLLKTAQQVVNEHNGQFPNEEKAIKLLKGIGDYTAAAILSFAFDLPYAVIDGNVKRVISRWFDIDTPIDSKLGLAQITQSLQQIFDIEKPAKFNQAIMDFGATQCTPKPKCETCPLKQHCKAYQNNTAEFLPIKSKKTVKKSRYFHYLFIQDGHNCVINRRGENDIWSGLHELPLIESELLNEIDIQNKVNSILTNTKLDSIAMNISNGKHILTHQNIFYQIHEVNLGKLNSDSLLIPYILYNPKEDQPLYGFPQLLKNFFLSLE